MKNMLENKLAQLSGDEGVGGSALTAANGIDNATAVETAKQRSLKDILLWVIALMAIIAATLVTQYLPQYWQPASSMWTRLIIIVGLVLLAFTALAFTHQGSAFKTLLIDSQIELRRVTWPSKSETIHYTWQVLLGLGILALLVWVLDTMFGAIIRLILG